MTNSSSSSYIICFARIADEEKANKIIKENNLSVFVKQDVEHEMRWTGYLGADWAGAELWDTKNVLKEHPDDKFIIIEDWIDASWDDDAEEYVFYYDFDMNDVIDKITEELKQKFHVDIIME